MGALEKMEASGREDREAGEENRAGLGLQCTDDDAGMDCRPMFRVL